ncbi:MAG: endonuclease/exonuclease/phosphatase family protein [Candidatus Omnitrophica bacterium]|nr:endonuclease/exonuclease/phosphatase family protein [Candidatus Omnitrophota bacterium]
MKSVLSATVFLALAVAPVDAASEFAALTFNIRYGTAKDEGHEWEKRKESVLAVIRDSSPDVVGLQEALDFQNHFLLDQLAPRYAFVGEGREGGTRGEYASILYRADRFFLARAGRFWLSDTPDIAGSMTWADLPRIVTWVDLIQRDGALRILVLNTHFAHNSENARLLSARLIRDRLKDLAPPEIPVMVMGDFNCRPGSPPHTVLLQEAGLADTQATLSVPPQGTFHGFSGKARDEAPIDWVLFRGLAPIGYKVLTGEFLGQLPSDHYPVFARFAAEGK